MKQLIWASVMVAGILAWGCDATRNEKPPPLTLDNDEPPLLLDDAEPLLLLDSPGPVILLRGSGDLGDLPLAEGPVADNNRCFVCHMNYSQERLAVGHARADVGCEKCHGACDAHCNDEDNITPPTIMFPRDEIITACKVCHDPDKDTEAELWCMREVKPADAGKVCTECHGKHVVPVRTVRWEKKTGKLLKGGWMGENKK